MRNILRNRTIIGIACIALSLAICFALTPLFNDAISSKLEVVRVAKDINEGDLITSDMLKTVTVGGYNLPKNVLRNREDIVGKYAVADLYKDDYIISSKLSKIPLANYSYLYNFDESKRAISVTIKSFAAGLSGKLEPRDIVSIVVSNYGENTETINPIELQYVELLAVTADTGMDMEEYKIKDKEDKELPSTVTLKVTPEQAILLAELEANGRIHIVFVYRGNMGKSDELLNEQEEILLKLQQEIKDAEKTVNDDTDADTKTQSYKEVLNINDQLTINNENNEEAKFDAEK